MYLLFAFMCDGGGGADDFQGSYPTLDEAKAAVTQPETWRKPQRSENMPPSTFAYGGWWYAHIAYWDGATLAVVATYRGDEWETAGL